MSEKQCFIEYLSGNGGFTKDGAFVLETVPQLPHSNIIAHNNFGTLITDSGGGYTWFQNSRENKLTEWRNDPVCDAPSESVIISDRLTGGDFSVSRLPVFRENARYEVTHGFGITSFICRSGGLSCRLDEFIDIDKEIKYYEVSIENLGKKRRGFGVSLKLSLVLGDFKINTERYIFAAKKDNCVLVRNAVSGAAACVYAPSEVFSFSYKDGVLSVSADAAAAPGEVIKLVFALSPHGACVTDGAAASRAKERAVNFFSALSKIRIDTPDPSFNALIDKWLPYQVYCSRFTGRCGFYQAGGAYGFRDQLQDCLGLLYVDPALVREHILRAASHQFAEGDAQHWWHPEKTGVRTRITDDFLWLPYVTAEYLEFTEDFSVLDALAPYLSMAELPAGTDVVYNSPPYSDNKETVYEHCIRALRRALRFGARGLNLIGTGDWNDAFDELGKEGRGESVWLTLFYYMTVEKFMPYVKDAKLRAELTALLPMLKSNVLEKAWDGRWFKRAFWDDGLPVGSKDSAEAQIDLIANAFAVISGVAAGDKAMDCIASVKERLVDKETGIIKLLDPPFTKKGKRAGYINDYPPGTRENGGQYTHAAVWYILSLYKTGMDEKAYDMLSLINPVNRCLTKETADIYKAEPYVMAADVYSAPGHRGRAGWTYYTGSAAWMYKTALEETLGLKINGNKLYVRPKAPHAWKEFSAVYGGKIFIRAVRTKKPEKRIIVDGIEYNLDYIILGEGSPKEVLVEF